MKPLHRLGTVLLFLFAVVLLWQTQPSVQAAPGTDQAAQVILPAGKPVQIKVPLGLPPLPIPPDNPPTAETIALGRRLYYDPLLSSDNSVSCASCHDPQTGFTDRHSVSQGVGRKTGTRHSPTVINSAYSTLQFWDGRAPSLE